TLRPFGPRVTLTASARASTPLRSFARASTSNISSFAAICRVSWNSGGWGSAELGEDVRGLDDHDLVAIDRERRPAVLPVEHLVADLEVDRHPLPLLEPARADRDHAALGRLLLGGVGDVEPPAHLLGLITRHDHDAMLERGDLQLALGGSHRLASDMVERLNPLGEPTLALQCRECQPCKPAGTKPASQDTAGLWQSACRS